MSDLVEKKIESPEDHAESVGTVERILAAAQTEFAAHGLSGARVDRIAQAAKVNKAMLYYHFHSKERLYLAVLRGFFDGVAQQLRQRVLPSGDAEEFLLAAAESHVRLIGSNREFMQILLRELAEPHEEIIDSIVGTLQAAGIPELGRERFRQDVERGLLRPVDPRQAIPSFISMSIGFLLLAPIIKRVLQIPEDEQYLHDRPKAIVDLFMNGVKAR